MELESYDVPKLAQYDTVDKQTSFAGKVVYAAIAAILAMALLHGLGKIAEVQTDVENMTIVCTQMSMQERVIGNEGRD